MKADVATAVRGRPREFCVDQALASALQVFWSKGYEGASMAELTEAMGITKPSLYAAFGNKEALFAQALDLYERDKLAYVSGALEAKTARGVAERLLRGSLDMLTGQSCPGGCLAVTNSMPCGNEAQSVREQVVARGSVVRKRIDERFEQAQRDGDLPQGITAQGLSAHLIAVSMGMSVQAGNGATREELEQLVETTLALWPTN